jgi:probable F420-dependent oxidoreductase
MPGPATAMPCGHDQPVKFSLSLPLLRDLSASDPFRETFELARLAEEAGFDTATIGHHHFMPGNMADPLTFLMAVAARTERLRVGTGIFQLPVHNPVRVAEQVATIDQVSGGRVSLGVGLGWWPLEYEVHGSVFKERGARMEEALEVLRLVWQGEETSFEGRFWSFPSLTVHPRPVQQPNPPLWVAGVVDAAIDRAARLGDAWLCGPVQSISKATAMVGTYRGACARHGKAPEWILRRYAWIAPTRAEVEDDVLPDYVDGLMAHWRESVEEAEEQALFARIDAGESVSPAEIADERLLWGSPDDVIAQIERYRARTGADHVHAAFGAGLPGKGQASMGDFEAQAAMIRLYGQEVIPALS